MTHEDFLVHQAALELIEQVQATPFDLIPLGDFSHTDMLNGKPLSPDTPVPLRLSPLQDLERACRIEALSKDGKVRFKMVTVTISRGAKSSKLSPFVLKALVANEQL